MKKQKLNAPREKPELRVACRSSMVGLQFNTSQHASLHIIVMLLYVYKYASTNCVILVGKVDSKKKKYSLQAAGRTTENLRSNSRLGLKFSQRLFWRFAIIWDIMSCNVTEVCLLPASCWFCTRLTLQPWRGRHVPPKRRVTFFGLHGFTSQNIELFGDFALRRTLGQT
jgi:hypothetical protein